MYKERKNQTNEPKRFPKLLSRVSPIEKISPTKKGGGVEFQLKKWGRANKLRQDFLLPSIFKKWKTFSPTKTGI